MMSAPFGSGTWSLDVRCGVFFLNGCRRSGSASSEVSSNFMIVMESGAAKKNTPFSFVVHAVFLLPPCPPISMLFCSLTLGAASAFSRNKFRKWMNSARHNIEIRGCGGREERKTDQESALQVTDQHKNTTLWSATTRPLIVLVKFIPSPV